MVAKRRAAIQQQPVLAIMLAIIRVDADAFLHRRKALLQLRAGKAATQTRLLLPFLQYLGRGSERSHLVNGRASPKRAACQYNDAQVL